MRVLEIDTTEGIAGNNCQTEEEQHGVPTTSALVFVEELSERHRISVHSRLFKPLEPHIIAYYVISPRKRRRQHHHLYRTTEDRRPTEHRRRPASALVMVGGGGGPGRRGTRHKTQERPRSREGHKQRYLLHFCVYLVSPNLLLPSRDT